MLISHPVSVVYIELQTALNTTYFPSVNPIPFPLSLSLCLSLAVGILSIIKRTTRELLPVSDTHYPQFLTHHALSLFFFFLQQTQCTQLLLLPPPLSQQCTGGWKAVTHIPAVTVNRAGATPADGP